MYATCVRSIESRGWRLLLPCQYAQQRVWKPLRPVCLGVLSIRGEEEEEVFAVLIAFRFQGTEHRVDAGLELGVEADGAVVQVEEDGFLGAVGGLDDG